ncbi:MAG: hypothetical protein IKG93_07470 [Clostridiales bacterium]|nr:hypothetical protein [Clostridiales bacterium]
MTELSRKKSLFVSYNIGVDLLMSFVFFFTTSSLGVFLLCYVHVIRTTYTAMCTAALMVPVYCLIRRLRIEFFPMLFLHLLASACYLIVMYFSFGKNTVAISNVIFLGFILLANILYSLKQRLMPSNSRVKNDGLLFSLILHFLLFLVFSFTGYHFRQPMIMTNSILMITAYFIARQFGVFEEKYFHNIHSATQPVSSIKKQNRMLVVIIVGGIVFSVVMLALFPTSQVLKLLDQLMRIIGGWLSRFFKEPEVKPEENELEEEIKNEIEDGVGTSTLTNILATISVVIVAICLFIFIVTMVRLILKQFRKAEHVEKTIENDAVTDVIESLEVKKKSVFHQDFGEGYEKEIRKKYYQRVTKAIKKGLPIKNSSSPHQIEKIIKRSGDPSISELTSQYESVRYNKK